MDGSRHWLDLPRDIVGLIFNKLRFPDQIRALAVCKTWRDCKGHVRCSDTLPWAVSCGKTVHCESDKYSAVICEFFDPYAQKVYMVSNLVKTYSDLELYTHGLASRNGWSLQGMSDCQLLLNNPFSNHKIVLPSFVYSQSWVLATMKADPSSPECEIFVLCLRDGYLSANTYCLLKGDDWQSELVVPMTDNEFFDLHSILYMNGTIYCVSAKGALFSYGLEDKYWKLLTPGFPEPCIPRLLDVNGNLILVCNVRRDKKSKWMIFRFDWPKMSWAETSLNGYAIYISYKVAFSAPLTNRHGEKLQGCKLFYNNYVFVADNDMGFKSYSNTDLMSGLRSDEYGWITPSFYFVEPPSFTV